MSDRRTTVITALSWRAWSRQLMGAPSVPTVMFVATFLTVACLSIAPRVLEHASVSDLRAELAAASNEQRNVRIEQDDRIGVSPTADQLARVRRRGDDLLRSAPASMASVIASHEFVVDSPRFDVVSYVGEDPGPFPTTFEFRAQDGIEEHLTLIEGEMPAAQPVRLLLRGSDCPPGSVDVDGTEPPRDLDEADCHVVTAPVFDTVLTAETAEAMGAAVGDEFILFPDPRDVRWRRSVGQQFGRRFVLRVAGIVELSDPGLSVWYDDSSLHRPRITENPDYRLVRATGVLSADRYRDFLRATVSVPLSYTWRYEVDTERVTPDDAAGLASELDRFAPAGAEVTTQLPDLITASLDQRSLTIGVMSAVVSGLFASAIGGLVALGMLGATRQRNTIRLTLERGADRRHVAADTARTAVVVVAPATAAGWIAASVALPGTDGRMPTWSAVVAAISAIAAVTLATVTVARRHGGRAHRLRPRASRSLRRLVVEGLVSAIAMGAVLLVRRRGSTSTPGRDFDPLLSAASGLVALSAALVACRLVVPLCRAVAAVAARGRGAVAFVGARKAADLVRLMAAPLVVMIGSIAIAVFAVTIGGSIERTQVDRSWSQVGADYRIESLNAALPLESMTELDQLPEHASTAGALVADDVSIEGPAGSTFGRVVAIDLGPYLDDVGLREESHVGTGTRAALAALDAANAAGHVEAPPPALVSTRWPVSSSLRLGDRFTVTIGSQPVDLSVHGFADAIAGIDDRGPFVVVDRESLEARLGPRAAQPNVVLGRGSRAGVERLTAALADDAHVVRVHSRYDELDRVAGDPFATWVRRVLVATVALSALFAALAAVAAFGISAAERDRDVSILRTLGLPRHGASRVIAVEQLPMIVSAAVFGTASGLLTARVLHPALGLGRLAGGDAAAPPVIEWSSIVTVAATVVFAIAVVGWAAAWRQVRRNDGSMLRTGDDR